MSGLKVSIIQFDITWGDKEANYKRLEQKIAEIDNDVNLIVLPEMFNSGFVMNPTKEASNQEDIFAWMKSQVKGKDQAIVGSAATFKDDKVVNRLYFATSDGVEHIYDKNHLFIHAGEDKKYAKGVERKIINYKGFNILLTVCFDLRFPVFNVNSNDYDVLINVACWPSSRRDHWQALLKARAIENQTYVIACNRVGDDPRFNYAGDSMIVDYNGEVLAHEEYKESILIADLNKKSMIEHREKFNFLMSQDEFTLHL